MYLAWRVEVFDTYRMRRLNYADTDFWENLESLLDTGSVEDISSEVRGIIDQIRWGGDRALIELTARFDHSVVTNVNELRVEGEKLRDAFDGLDSETRDALEVAKRRIESYHRHQISGDWSYLDELGNELGQRMSPIEKVGIYIPGGKAVYPSSVLMNAIPARVAGVGSLTMVSPGGKPNQLVMAAAYLCEVDYFYSIGGVQAIAALAYGTESIQSVDKITGPGNAYVAEAKRQVFGKVGIDMIAGPSEILIISDGKQNPDWMAFDLFAQAEHDELAQSILISDDEEFLNRVQKSIDKLLPEQRRSNIISASLGKHGALINVENLNQAVEIANFVAPEHLELALEHPDEILNGIKHAGAIFVGECSCEVLGDYCVGPNHTLPTNRSARFSNPLGVRDFQKASSLIRMSKEGSSELSKIAELLAKGEGLFAHAASAKARQKLI